MIKISTNLKDVIESLSDLITIGESNIIPPFVNLSLKEDIICGRVVPNKQNHVLIKGVYFLDSKGLIYTLAISDEELKKEFGEEIEPPQLNVELTPLKINPANTPNPIHLHIFMLLETLYRYNIRLLSSEQEEILYDYFIAHHPQVIFDDQQETEREAFIKSIKNIQTVFPPNQIKPIDKVTLKAFEGAIMFNDYVQVDVGKKPNSVYIDVALELDNENIKGIEKFNEYDHAVHDAICTLCEYENWHITPSMIYHVMVGNSKARITENHFNKITESFDKLRSVKITIDATNEVEKHKRLKHAKFDGYAVAADKVEAITLNNEKVNGYKLLRPPILLSYAKEKKQISTIPMQLLNTPINKTDDTIILQNYLLKRISAMKNKNNSMGNVILYDAVYHEVELHPSDEQAKIKKARCRDYIKKIFDYWKEQKFIKNYTEVKKGKSFYSIEITC